MTPNVKRVKRAVLLIADNSDLSGSNGQITIETWVGIDHKQGYAQCSVFVQHHGVF